MIFAEVSGEERVLTLEAADCSIRLEAIYEGVKTVATAPGSGGPAEEQTA